MIRVSISSTSEEVRDTANEFAGTIQKILRFPLVPLPKKCVTFDPCGSKESNLSVFPLVPLPKKCVTMKSNADEIVLESFH